MPERTLLLVEDEAVIAMMEAAMLRDNGYAVLVAASGEKVVAPASVNPSIDLVPTGIANRPDIQRSSRLETTPGPDRAGSPGRLHARVSLTFSTAEPPGRGGPLYAFLRIGSGRFAAVENGYASNIDER